MYLLGELLLQIHSGAVADSPQVYLAILVARVAIAYARRTASVPEPRSVLLSAFSRLRSCGLGQRAPCSIE